MGRCASLRFRPKNSQRRKLPEDAPTDFLPRGRKPIVINHAEIDRRAWESALLLKLRDELKAGILSGVNIRAKYIYWSYAYWSPPEGGFMTTAAAVATMKAAQPPPTPCGVRAQCQATWSRRKGSVVSATSEFNSPTSLATGWLRSGAARN